MQRWWPLLLLMLVLPLRFPGALPGPRVVSADDHLTVHHAFQDADAGGTVHHPHLSDPALQFKALQRRTVASLRRGEAPLWNPDLYAGAPLLADGQSMPASPVTWLRALLPEDLAQDLGVSWVLLWLGLGTALLVAALGAGPWGAAVGGVAAMLGPYPSVWLLHPHAATFCWLPWVVLAVERRSGWGAAVAVAGMAGGGHPGTLAQGLAIAGAWWLLRRRSAETAAGVVAGLLLASPVLAPLAEQAGRSSTLGARHALPLEPRQLLDLVWPGALGHPARGTWTGPGSWADGQLHPGLGALALALWGAARGRGRGLLAGWLVLVGLSLLPLPGPFAHGRLASQGAWLVALGAGLALAPGAGRWRPPPVALLALVLGTGLWARWDDQRSLPADAHDPAPAPWTSALRAALGCPGSDQRCPRVLGLGWALQPNTGALAGLPDLRGYDLPVSADTQRLMTALNPRPKGPWYPVEELPSTALLRFLGVGAVLTPPGAEIDLDPIALADAPLAAWRVADVAPEAWVARGRPAQDARAALAQVAADPKAWARPPVEGLTEPLGAGDPQPVPVRWTGDARVDLDLPGGAAGILVLQQAWAPGWRITVDGAPRQSLRVGGVLLGAAVAAGDQQVTLRYRPDGWIAGQRMAIAGAALWLGLLLWARRRWRVLG